MAMTNIVDWKTITNFVIDAFTGYGIPRADAEICADVLLASDKRGITTQIVRNARRNAFLSVDGGKSLRMNMGDVAVIRKSDLETKLLRLKNKSFFDVENS